MAVAYRAEGHVVNGTAGTSVVVPRPTGTVDGDCLIACVSQAGTSAVTAPAGWTLIGAQSGTGVRMDTYVKIARSEPASWTWTLGSSVRNWGAVSSWTGVDPVSPVASSASSPLGGVTFFSVAQRLWFGAGVAAFAAVRTASGTPTTWTVPVGVVELLDVSTNGGTGTDITGSIQGQLATLPYDVESTLGATASQLQTAGVGWRIELSPNWALPKPSAAVVSTVEIAPGADPTADPATWPWVDVTARAKSSLQITRGAQDATSTTQPSTGQVTLENTDGWLTIDNPVSPWYGLFGIGTPIRFKVNLAIGSFIRFQGKITSCPPRWPAGTEDYCVVPIVARGVLNELGHPKTEAHSSLYRAIIGDKPDRYWPCEVTSGAVTIPEASGGPPLVLSGDPASLGSGGPPGSAPLITLGQYTRFDGAGKAVPVTAWSIECYCKVPAPPATDMAIIEWHTSGSPIQWRLGAMASGNVALLAWDFTSGLIVDFESTPAIPIYGQDLLWTVSAQQSGGNVAFEFIYSGQPPAGGGRLGGSIAGTIGPITNVTIPPGDRSGWVIGHISTWSRTLDSPFGAGVFTHSVGLNGSTGKKPWRRATDAILVAGVTIDRDEDAQYHLSGPAMGPEVIGTPLAIARDAELTDLGLLTDGLGPGGRYLSGDHRINMPVTMALSVARGHLKSVFEPAADDEVLGNQLQVSNSNGSTTIASDVDSVARSGGYPTQATLNLFTDLDLANQGAFRARMSAQSALRVPLGTIDLRDTPELIPRWLRMDIGYRYTTDTLPAQYGPNGLDQTLAGYAETIDAVTWLATLTGAPFSPWRVGVWAADTGDTGEFVGRWDCDEGATTLVGSLTAKPAGTADSFSITTVAGTPLWTTLADDFPLDVDIGGERITVTTITGTGPQTVTCKRGTNGVAKAHPAGSPMSVWQCSVWALPQWDL